MTAAKQNAKGTQTDSGIKWDGTKKIYTKTITIESPKSKIIVTNTWDYRGVRLKQKIVFHEESSFRKPLDKTVLKRFNSFGRLERTATTKPNKRVTKIKINNHRIRKFFRKLPFP